MRRVFAVDVLECPKCGAKMKILATIHPPEATTAILRIARAFSAQQASAAAKMICLFFIFIIVFV